MKGACGPDCGYCGRCGDGMYETEAEREIREHERHGRHRVAGCPLCDEAAELAAEAREDRNLED